MRLMDQSMSVYLFWAYNTVAFVAFESNFPSSFSQLCRSVLNGGSLTRLGLGGRRPVVGGSRLVIHFPEFQNLKVNLNIKLHLWNFLSKYFLSF